MPDTTSNKNKTASDKSASVTAIVINVNAHALSAFTLLIVEAVAGKM